MCPGNVWRFCGVRSSPYLPSLDDFFLTKRKQILESRVKRNLLAVCHWVISSSSKPRGVGSLSICWSRNVLLGFWLQRLRRCCNEFLNISSPLTIGPAMFTESMVWAKDGTDKELRYQLIQRPEVFRFFNHVESWIDVSKVFTLWYKLYLKRPATLSNFPRDQSTKIRHVSLRNPWSWRELSKLANRDNPT